MQHDLHSEFKEIRQIDATIHFDAEEALANDVSEVSIAYEVVSKDKTGSELAVFTSKKEVLSRLIYALQGRGIDPVIIEPDINSLVHYLTAAQIAEDESKSFYALLSKQNGYFLTSIGEDKKFFRRTFLAKGRDDRGKLLARELSLTSAMISGGQGVQSYKAFDSIEKVDCESLEGVLGRPVSLFDPAEHAGGQESLTDCEDAVEFAIAYGAALACTAKSGIINFRRDYMPYMGKRLRLQKTIKFLGVAATILMIGIGVYGHLELMNRKKPYDADRKIFEEDYTAVMMGKAFPKNFVMANYNLRKELNRITNVKEGREGPSGSKSIAAKLTMVLAAFNKSAKRTNLQIDKVSVTGKTISVTGRTSSRPNTLFLRSSLEESGLNVESESIQVTPAGDEFKLSIKPKS
jgi:hypothetical protein